jgi:hypothetical protein
MSTSCIIVIREDEIPIVAIQAHAEGYPSGRGLELANFLTAAKLVLKADGTTYNGAGCLAASLVKLLKQGVGGIYLTSPSHAQVGDCNYLYFVDIDELKITNVNVYEKDRLVFNGSPKLFKSFCKKS